MAGGNLNAPFKPKPWRPKLRSSADGLSPAQNNEKKLMLGRGRNLQAMVCLFFDPLLDLYIDTWGRRVAIVEFRAFQLDRVVTAVLTKNLHFLGGSVFVFDDDHFGLGPVNFDHVDAPYDHNPIVVLQFPTGRQGDRDDPNVATVVVSDRDSPSVTSPNTSPHSVSASARLLGLSLAVGQEREGA